MDTTLDLKFDFARITHFPYDDSYYDDLEQEKDLEKAQLTKDPLGEMESDSDDGPSNVRKGTVGTKGTVGAEETKGTRAVEPQERLLLSLFFTERLALQRLEYIIWPNGRTMPYKVGQPNSWDLLHIVETWALQNTMSFKSLFLNIDKE